MDAVDLAISKFLLWNSRQSYREIAENLNLSINAIHKRISNLIDQGIVARFRTNLTLEAFRGIKILIIGKTRLFSLKILEKNIKRDDRFYWITFGAGNMVYFGIYLRYITELQDVVSFAKNAGDLSDITVGIITPVEIDANIEDLSILDYRIIQLMQKDSRIPATDIAQQLEVSAKTINNHIKDLAENYLVEFTIDWFPDKEGTIMGFFHITVGTNSTTMALNQQLTTLFPDNNVFNWSFSNLPQFLFSVWLVESFEQLNEIRERVHQISGVEKIEINMMYEGVILETWKDKFPSHKIKKFEKGNDENIS